jgi:tetratricopeptide (TPR) repeat protein
MAELPAFALHPVLHPVLGLAVNLLFNGVFVTVLAILLVMARVLWPKETIQRWRANRRFQTSVDEMRQGLERLEDEQYDAALNLFAQAAKQTPNKPAPVLLRIYALGMQGRRREAASELRHALLRWPVETLPRRLLALAYLGAGNFDRAYAAATAAVGQEPIAAVALRTLGDVCRIMERYPEAERAYLHSVELGLARPYAGLAWALAGQGRVEEAEAVLGDAPTHILSLFEARLTLAQIHTQARRLDQAVAVYQTLLQEHGNVPRVLVPYGLTLMEDVQMNEAQKVLERAVGIAPDDPFAQCALAALLVERNDLATATVHVREALRLWPGYGTARSVYGDVMKRSGRYDAAEEQYREALRLNPFLADAHIRLAALLRMRSETMEAREHEREAHRLRPSMPLPVSQKILAVTTRQIAAANGATQPTPRTTPREATPPDINIVLTPTKKRLPDRLASAPLPPPRPSAPATRSSTSLMSDIAALPGAVLLFDESRESIFSQTLQSARPPGEVLAFYRQHLAADGWAQTGEEPSTMQHIQGVTLHYVRGDQFAHITIGLRADAPPDLAAPEERYTIIITHVTHRG